MLIISKNWHLYLLLLFSQLGFAGEIYKWTDIKGRLHYSDTKHVNATELKLIQDFSFYQVKKVYDGDTVLLNDGRKIRLLGINTPEVEHSNQAAQAGGGVARQRLQQQLVNARVRLEFDQQKQDKYKRHLAHVFTEQGVHLNLQLVRLGYAATSTYPPNLKYLPELLAAQQIAETKRLGIWQYSEYAPKLSNELNKNNKQGWQRIIGRVLRIKKTPKSCYLKMTGNFDVRIKIEHKQYFADLVSLIGKKIEVRGWVKKYKNGYSMLVKHPSAMKILD
ncbi:thermonuclease family protein [Methyloprofundus sp.]|uniref:thermonuclease family protein n=1 Tax=Methyloprofundus sp. TaxID=2020875 RepID=UPI003D098A5E